MGLVLESPRLRIRSWTVDDTEGALATYGTVDVTGWLTPATDRIGDAAAMRAVLAAWVEAAPNLTAPRGRWAIERISDATVIGGLAIRLLPPYEEDMEVSFQLRPDAWGYGYAVEAATTLIRWAFAHGADELFAVAKPQNRRAIAAARRIGMEWVGETDKYYGRTLQIYRIRPDDLTEE